MARRNFLLSLTFGAVAMTFGTCAVAATHVVKAGGNLKWEYNGKSAQITPVDDLAPGDTVEIQIPDTAIPHGFSTTKIDPMPIVPTEDPVLKCGEEVKAKPNAVLKEIECGDKSKFGAKFKGSMKLEVLQAFKLEVPFWCVVHKGMMQGVLKLKADAPSTAKN